MKADQCEFCEGEMKQQRVLARFRFKGQTIYIENVPTWVCNRCSEQYFDAPIYKRLEAIAQQRKQIQRVISFPLAEFDMAIGRPVNKPPEDDFLPCSFLREVCPPTQRVPLLPGLKA